MVSSKMLDPMMRKSAEMMEATAWETKSLTPSTV